MNYYEVYDKKTGYLLARGTARECRRQLGLPSLDSFYAIVGRTLSGKYKKYIVVKKKGGETDYPVIEEGEHSK